MGGGVYRPPTKVLTALRDQIVDKPGVWTRVRNQVEETGLELGGDRLKSKPRGYDADHPHLDDLRRTSFVFTRSFSEEEATADHFLDTYVSWCEDAKPFLAWICRGLGVPW